MRGWLEQKAPDRTMRHLQHRRHQLRLCGLQQAHLPNRERAVY